MIYFCIVYALKQLPTGSNKIHQLNLKKKINRKNKCSI